MFSFDGKRKRRHGERDYYCAFYRIQKIVIQLSNDYNNNAQFDSINRHLMANNNKGWVQFVDSNCRYQSIV